jgi:hypothetical protein
MTKASSEAQKRARELIELPLPRHELAPQIARALQELMDEHHGWVSRVETAEWETKDALKYAKAAEKAAAAWKARADASKQQFDDLRVALEVALIEPKRNWVQFIEHLLIANSPNPPPAETEHG